MLSIYRHVTPYLQPQQELKENGGDFFARVQAVQLLRFRRFKGASRCDGRSYQSWILEISAVSVRSKVPQPVLRDRRRRARGSDGRGAYDRHDRLADRAAASTSALRKLGPRIS